MKEDTAVSTPNNCDIYTISVIDALMQKNDVVYGWMGEKQTNRFYFPMQNRVKVILFPI